MILGPETFHCGYRLITSASLSRSSRLRMIVGPLALRANRPETSIQVISYPPSHDRAEPPYSPAPPAIALAPCASCDRGALLL